MNENHVHEDNANKTDKNRKQNRQATQINQTSNANKADRRRQGQYKQNRRNNFWPRGHFSNHKVEVISSDSRKSFQRLLACLLQTSTEV